MNPISIIAIAGALYTIGDIALANWARGSSIAYLVAGLAINFLGIILYAHCLRFENLGAATAVLLGLNIFAVTIAGACFFQESLTAVRAAGLVVLVSGIVLVEVIG